ncbi:MAG: TonB-dependent receptor [Bacteroidales bacterium]|nr:TonB-dependent receptor [Bacteroidales bacterium]
MMDRLRLLFVLTVLGCAMMLSASAQNSSSTVTVKGVVVDEQGLPAIGASVVVVGKTSTGVVTDEKGAFTIKVPSGSLLNVSYMGYADQSRKVTKDILDWYVQLEVDSNFIEDAVVVGYGVQKKESIVGAISTVSSEQLADAGTQDLTSALSGKVSGLLMTTESGAPGSTTSMMLRGVSSFSAGGNSPLVMVDGVERTMADLNPAEVQSISVLKDASATAVFGSKGANGVILVTTKAGREGRAKMHARAEFGVKSPLRLPMSLGAEDILTMSNVALKNDQSFAALHSDAKINNYRSGLDPYRYPNVNWYDEMLNAVAPSYNASFDISGGTKRVKYYAMGSYYHDGSLIKQINHAGPIKYTSDRINYRLNLDASLTKTTDLSVRFGGSVTINNIPNGDVTEGQIWNEMYMASTIAYPAYFPADIYEKYPDPNYPDAEGIRIANNSGQNFENPIRHLLYNNWEQTSKYRILTDIVLKQDLSFITKGLSAKIMASLTTTYYRISQTSSQALPRWSIDWERYDAGDPDIWNSSEKDVTTVFVPNPLSVTMGTAAKSVGFTHYIEGSLNYARKFKGHDVAATAVYNQRQVNNGAGSPQRNQSIVGRATYNYKQRYLFEANLGITGSEQFAPNYRYGIFPSIAAGYTISKEKFWKKAMPWWSTMKIRGSWGLVGTETSSGFLYYTAYDKVSYKNFGMHYKEGAAANEGARWETADKKDIGIEMGFFKDNLTINVDFFDEYRYDMLMTPVTTPLLGVGFKQTNSGALKKHGVDIDVMWRKNYRSGFFYSIGAMVSLNENRIVKYADIPFNPEYKKVAGTPSLSQRTGSTLVDDKYFQTINEIHGYPAFTSSWLSLMPGVYKFLDYKPEGSITDEDLHVVPGSSYPPCTYSLNLSLGYKGFTFRMVGVGTVGKYIQFKRAYMIPFMAGDLSAHQAQLDYWSPTNRDAAAPALTYNDQMYSWAGGTSAYPGYNLALDGYTWRNSDYFNIQELYFGYKFDGKKLRQVLGIDGLTVSLSCNNLFIFTGLIEGNPQMHNTSTSYYPLMRTTKLGINLNF